ncbi:hypothetical protein A7975_05015 [Bacillus sp. FJAT-26390]|nr:hypothetical protein A7975_05015 [Bacillus sp. FJAT-26390]
MTTLIFLLTTYREETRIRTNNERHKLLSTEDFESERVTIQYRENIYDAEIIEVNNKTLFYSLLDGPESPPITISGYNNKGKKIITLIKAVPSKSRLTRLFIMRNFCNDSLILVYENSLTTSTN